MARFESRAALREVGLEFGALGRCHRTWRMTEHDPDLYFNRVPVAQIWPESAPTQSVTDGCRWSGNALRK